MQITDVLAQMGGLQSMARELGVSEAQAAAGVAALAPAILGGFKKQAQAQPAGLEGLGGLLGQRGGGGLLDDVLAPQPTDLTRGDDVLGQIFGSKDVSRAVAQNAAGPSGLGPSLLKKMLTVLTMLVAGFMVRQGGSAPAGPSPMGGVFGGGGQSGGQGGDQGGGWGGPGGLGGLLGSLRRGQAAAGASPGAGGPASMLDLDGDGNPLDDIPRMVGQVKR